MYYKYSECFPKDGEGSALKVIEPKVKGEASLLKKLY